MHTDLELFLPTLDLLQDVVLSFDSFNRLVYANAAARDRFQITAGSLPAAGDEVFQNWPELLSLISGVENQVPAPAELALAGESTYDVQVVKNPQGYTIFLHDVSRLKQRSMVGGNFINSITHDLRSPLTAILGYVELIDRVGELNGIQRDFMQRVISSVQHINTLMNDLLVLAMCESGEVKCFENVQINQLIHKVTGARYKQMLERDLNLEIDIPGNIQVSGVADQLKILLEKLLDNAIQYTPSGKKVRLSCQEETDRVVIQVSDTGIGIPAGETSLIFNRFYRGSNSSDSLGTGLGLSIVQAIILNHGGKISVESVPGEGSSFTVWLPRTG